MIQKTRKDGIVVPRITGALLLFLRDETFVENPVPDEVPVSEVVHDLSETHRFGLPETLKNHENETSLANAKAIVFFSNDGTISMPTCHHLACFCNENIGI